MNKLTISLLFFFNCLNLFFAASTIKLIEPQQPEVKEYELVDYGTIGPGNTFLVKIDPIVRNSKGDFLGQWDWAEITKLPEGWKADKSKIYGNPLVMEIIAPRDAEDGVYELEIKLVDEKGQEKIGEEFVFGLQVKVDRKILETKITQESKIFGANQPAKFYIEIKNLGNAKDVFILNIKGVKEWEVEKYIYIPPKESKNIVYEINSQTPGTYELKIEVKSTSSDRIFERKKIDFLVKTDVLSEYKAVNYGVILFPLTQLPMYAIAGLIGLLFP
ncbi:MAG: hypothetical protein ACK4J0_00495 [Candidatus Anstonellaceae archaeon]